MTDIFTKEKRSEIMSHIRGTNTSIELKVFRLLRANNVYFQRHYRKAPGCPDIALPSKKLAVFLDGDFWHGYKFPIIKNRLPKGYWSDKIKENINRDRRNRRKLRASGWLVLRIWQHEIENDIEQVIEKTISFLRQKR